MNAVEVEYDSQTDTWGCSFGPIGQWRTEVHLAAARARPCIHAIETPPIMLFTKKTVKLLPSYPIIFPNWGRFSAIASRTNDLVTMAVDHLDRIVNTERYHRELIKLTDATRFIYRLLPVRFSGEDEVHDSACLGVWPD